MLDRDEVLQQYKQNSLKAKSVLKNLNSHSMQTGTFRSSNSKIKLKKLEPEDLKMSRQMQMHQLDQLDDEMATGEETLPRNFDIRIEHADIADTRNQPAVTMPTSTMDEAKIIRHDMETEPAEQPSQEDEMFTTDHGFRKSSKAAASVESSRSRSHSRSQQPDDGGAFLTSIPVEKTKTSRKGQSKPKDGAVEVKETGENETNRKSAEDYVEVLMKNQSRHDCVNITVKPEAHSGIEKVR